MKPYFDNGSVQIWHGDCRDVLDHVGAFDLVVTDPPYASGARRDADRQVRGAVLRSLDDPDWFSHDAMTSWGFGWFLRSVCSAIRPRLPQGAHVYVFTDWRQQPNVYGLLEASGYRVNHSLVWDKGALGMGSGWRNQHEHIVAASHGMPADMLDRGMGSVITEPTVHHSKRVHPTEKPVRLMRRIIEAVPGGVVLDPFAGSGPTLRAAFDAGRKAIGCEIDERYCEIAARRLEAQPSLFEPAPEQGGLF